MRLSRNFAFLPAGIEHTNTSIDTPTEVEGRRSSLDSFVIPRRTRFPSSKQDRQDTNDYDIIHTLFNNNQHTDTEQVRVSGAVDVPISPRKRRGFLSTSFNKENKSSPSSMTHGKGDDQAKAEKPPPTDNERPLVLMREQQSHWAGLNSLTANDPSRKSSSTYCSERPGSIRSAKEYNILARQHKLPEFNYKNFHQTDPKLSCPEVKRHSFFGRLLSKRASTLQMTTGSKTPALKHSRSTFNFLHIEGVYKDVLANRSLEEISRIGGLHSLKLPREYAVETYAVPTVVSAAIGYLLKHGITTPGIFRISGQKTTIDALYSWYSNLCMEDQHGQQVLKTLGNGALPKHINYNPHDVASLLKKFIGGLHGGLLGSVELFNTLNGALINLERQPEQTEESFTALKAQIIALLISSIPNAKQMHLICAFFGLTAAIGEETEKMKASGISRDKTNELMGHRALGVVFGPLLLADLEAELDLGADRVNANRPAPPTPRRYWKEKRKSQVIDIKLEQDIRHRQALVRINAATNLANELLTYWKPAIAELQKIERRRNQEYLNRPSPADSLFTLPGYQVTSFGRPDDISERAQQGQDTRPATSKPQQPAELVDRSPKAKQDNRMRENSDGRFFDILEKQKQEVKIQPRRRNMPPSARSSMFENHGSDADDEMDVNEAFQRLKPERPSNDKNLLQVNHSPGAGRSIPPNVGHVQFLDSTPLQEDVGAANDFMQEQRKPSASSIKFDVTTSPRKRTFSSFRSKYLEVPASMQDQKPRPLSDVHSDRHSSPECSVPSPPGLSHVDKVDPRRYIQLGQTGLSLPDTDAWVGKHMGSPTSSTLAELASSPELRKDDSASSAMWEHFDSRPLSRLTTPEVPETLHERDERSIQREGNIRALSPIDHRNVTKISHCIGDANKHDSELTVRNANSTHSDNFESPCDLYHDADSAIEPKPRPRRQAKGSAEAIRPLSASFDKFHAKPYQDQGNTSEEREKAKLKLRMNVFSGGSSTQTQAAHDPIKRDASPQDTIPQGPLHAPGEVIPPTERPRQESFNKVKDRWVSWSSSSEGSSNMGSSDRAHRELSPIEVRDANRRRFINESETQQRRPRRESVKALAGRFVEEKALPETPAKRPISIHRKPLLKTPIEQDLHTDSTEVRADAPDDGSIKGNAIGAARQSRSVSPSKESRIPQPSYFNGRIRSSGKNLRHSISPIVTRDPSSSPTPRAAPHPSQTPSDHHRKSLFSVFGGCKSSLDFGDASSSPTKRIKVDASKNLDRIMSESPESMEGSVAPADVPIPEVEYSSPQPFTSMRMDAPRGVRTASSVYNQHTFGRNKEGSINRGKGAVRNYQQVITPSSAPPPRLPRDWVGSGVYRSPTSGKLSSQSAEALHHVAVDRRGGGIWDIPFVNTPARQQSRQTSTTITDDDSAPNVPRESLDTRSSSLDERSKAERREARDYRNNILRHMGERGMTLREYSASSRTGCDGEGSGTRIPSEVDIEEPQGSVATPTATDSLQQEVGVLGTETPTSSKTHDAAAAAAAAGSSSSSSKKKQRLMVMSGSASSRTCSNITEREKGESPVISKEKNTEEKEKDGNINAKQ